MPSKKLSLLVLVLALLTACSSEADPGEACGLPGGTRDVCASGTVCGKPIEQSGGLACIFICGDDGDCPRDAECKGVDGTNIKGCRYKK